LAVKRAFYFIEGIIVPKVLSYVVKLIIRLCFHLFSYKPIDDGSEGLKGALNLIGIGKGLGVVVLSGGRFRGFKIFSLSLVHNIFD
jgi:hypothetical protein